VDNRYPLFLETLQHRTRQVPAQTRHRPGSYDFRTARNVWRFNSTGSGAHFVQQPPRMDHFQPRRKIGSAKPEFKREPPAFALKPVVWAHL